MITRYALGSATAGGGASVYPLTGWADFHSITCDPTEAQVSGAFSAWQLRVWVPAGNPITQIGMVVNVAGTLGAGGLNGFGVYTDDGQTLLGQTVSDDDLWTATGLQTATMQTNIGAAGSRFIRVLCNVAGYSAAPAVAYAVPVQQAQLNGPGGRRSAFMSTLSSFPASFTPGSTGTATNFLPLLAIG